MHSCLVTAPTITEFHSIEELMSDAVQSAACQPQLGILSVAAILERCGDTPSIVDVNQVYLAYAQRTAAFQADGFAEHVAKLAVRSNADLYGFSSICSTYPLSIRIARELKKIRPYAMVLFGGPQASVVDVATIEQFSFVDFILRGEVEETLPSLIQELHRDYNLSGVGGLTYRDGMGVRRNPNAQVIEDLDELPRSAYHLTDHLRNATTAFLELGRGCPFSCTFCSTNDFFRRKFRLRSPARVLQEMRGISGEYGIQDFELVHDMFTVDRKRVVSFCEEMLASGENFTWGCSARTDCVDEELLGLMARSGCRSVFFGIETGSRRMQRLIDKDLDPERAEEVLDIAERLQISTTASLITGFPEEGWSDVRETLRIFTHSARCSKSQPQLNLLAPLAGTPIYATHKHELVLQDLCSDISHQGLTQSNDDLELIRQHPDIFPNFYLIPLKGLDPDALFDLREFLTMTVECFRWLLGAVDQTTDLLQFHHDWRVWRIKLRGDLVGSNLRRYYVGKQFRSDFTQFLSQHPIREMPKVFVLLCVEQFLKSANKTLEDPEGKRNPIASGEPLQVDDVPYNGGELRILQLEYKLEEIARSIATRTEPRQRECSFYAPQIDEDGIPRLVEISSWLANVIKVCDGRAGIVEIVDRLGRDLPEVAEATRDYVFGRLLMGAQAAGFIDVHRPT